MTSIDGIVKSEIIKEKSYFFLVWKFQEKVENGSLASRSKQFFLEAPHKAKYSLALILLSLFCWRWEIGNGSNIHIVYFLDTHLTHLRLSETETGKEHLETGKANVRESSQQDLKSFGRLHPVAPCFARNISKMFETEVRLQSPSPLPGHFQPLSLWIMAYDLFLAALKSFTRLLL